ncbi:MAG: hypothetical protein HQ593_01060 [Candidatus Omnitrophica bacterium]|nr:hypothetical protein [Candidatus Omnitrophota bacterium]
MKGMTLIVKTVTRWVKGFIFLFGLYIILFGHLTPGGGFAGGVILACSYILLTLAYSKEVAHRSLSRAVASELDSVGALIFLSIALLGIYFGGGFFVNFIHRLSPGEPFRFLSAGIIPLCNVAIGIKVGSSLFMIFVILSAMRVIVRKSDNGREIIDNRRKHPR